MKSLQFSLLKTIVYSHVAKLVKLKHYGQGQKIIFQEKLWNLINEQKQWKQVISGSALWAESNLSTHN